MNYLYILILSFILLYLTKILSEKLNLYDVPDNIKIHKIRIPNIAGLALIPFTIFLIYNYDFIEEVENTLYIFLIVILIGLIDDIKNIKPKYKLLALLIPILIFTNYVAKVNTLGVYNNFNLNLGDFSFIFTILCIFLLTNAYNYIDGIDGLLATNLIITLIFFELLTYETFNMFISLIIFLIVYLFFNINFLKLFPKQFIGDSGSLGFGFLISTFLIIYTQIENVLHPSVVIWFVAFIVYEFLAINIIRIKLKKNIFKRDLNFVFNLLSKNYSNRKSLIICSLLHLSLCSISLIIYYTKIYLFSLVLFFIFFIFYLIFRFRQIKFF